MTKLAATKQAMAALSPESILETDYQAKGYHLDIKVAPEQVTDAASVLDKEKFFIEAITGVDWLGEKAALQKEKEKAAAAAAKKAAEATEAGAEGEVVASPGVSAETQEPPAGDLVDDLEVIYDFNSTDELCRVVVRTRVPRDNPELPTISQVFPGANWHERETHDFFGIQFVGHPDLSPLLLPEDADYHPLLKDFQV